MSLEKQASILKFMRKKETPSTVEEEIKKLLAEENISKPKLEEKNDSVKTIPQ